MTYEEFKEIIENKQGHSVMREGDFCTIRNNETNTPLTLINLTKRHALDLFLVTDESDIRFMVYNWYTICEFVETPIEERKVPKL